jgi:hypothetical protein
MLNRMILLLPAMLLAVALSAGASLAERAANAGNDCLAKPGSQAAEGRHWYYRIDRSSNRRCWYLGDVGSKVRKASVLKRRSALKPLPQRSARARSEAFAKTHAPASEADALTELPASESESADFFKRWPNYVRPAATIDREPESMRNSYADEHAATPSPDDMPLIWPILGPAEVVAAASSPRSTFNTEIIYGMIAGALGAGLLARTILNIVTKRRRLDPLDQLPVVARMAKPRLKVRPAASIAKARQPGGPRDPIAAARRAASGQGFPNRIGNYMPPRHALDSFKPPNRRQQTTYAPAGAGFGSKDAGQDIEQNLRQLLAGWQRTPA